MLNEFIFLLFTIYVFELRVPNVLLKLYKYIKLQLTNLFPVGLPGRSGKTRRFPRLPRVFNSYKCKYIKVNSLSCLGAYEK